MLGFEFGLKSSLVIYNYKPKYHIFLPSEIWKNKFKTQSIKRRRYLLNVQVRS